MCFLKKMTSVCIVFALMIMCVFCSGCGGEKGRRSIRSYQILSQNGESGIAIDGEDTSTSQNITNLSGDLDAKESAKAGGKQIANKPVKIDYKIADGGKKGDYKWKEVSDIWYTSDEIDYYAYRQYDENGRILSVKHESSETKYKYNSDGTLNRAETNDEDEGKSYRVYKYDKSKNLIEVKTFSADGTELCQETCKYDSKNNLIEKTSKDCVTGGVRTTTYAYNGEKLIKEESAWNDGFEKISNEYDSKGRIIRCVHLCSVGVGVNYVEKTEYNANGDAVKIYSYLLEGEDYSQEVLMRKIDRKYDNNHNMLSSIEMQEEDLDVVGMKGTGHAYLYKYDSNNNPVEEKFYDIEKDGTWVFRWSTKSEYEYSGSTVKVKETVFDDDGKYKSHYLREYKLLPKTTDVEFFD